MGWVNKQYILCDGLLYKLPDIQRYIHAKRLNRPHFAPVHDVLHMDQLVGHG